MPRVSEIPDDDATPEQRQLFAGDRALFGEVLNASRVYANRADAFLGIHAFHGALAERSVLPPDLVALARLRVAQLHDSPF